MKKAVSFLFKVIIVLIIFHIISKTFNLKELSQVFKKVTILPFVIAFTVALINRVFTTLKWHILLKYHGIHEKYFTVLKIVFESQFLGLLFPTSFGVDAVRFYRIQKKQSNFSATAGSILVDRIFAVFTMSSMCIIASIFSFSAVNNSNVIISVILIASLTILLIICLISSLPTIILRIASRQINNLHLLKKDHSPLQTKIFQNLKKTKQKIEEIHQNFQRIKKEPKIFLQLAILNFIVQFSRIIEIHFLFRCFNVDVPFFFEMSFVPMIILITLLPVPFFGLGFKEGAFIFFFSEVNIPQALSFSVSLLSYPLLLAGILPGAFFFMTNKQKEKNKV